MSFAAHYDSLARVRMSPYLSPQDMSKVPLAAVVLQACRMRGEPGAKPRPHAEAFRFYLLQHAFGELRQQYGFYEPVPPALVLHLYRECLARQAPPLLYYLLYICTREVRHARQDAIAETALVSAVGQTTMDFLTALRDESREVVISRLEAAPPAVDLARYTSALVEVYRRMPFRQGNYGGEKWAVLAEVLRDFVSGKFSTEVLLDMGYALAHNSSLIFNKGMFYNDDFTELPALRVVLDVQRAGQLPALAATLARRGWLPGRVADPLSTAGTATLIQGLYTDLEREMGWPADAEVDWVVVERLSPSGSSAHVGASTPPTAEGTPAVPTVQSALIGPVFDGGLPDLQLPIVPREEGHEPTAVAACRVGRVLRLVRRER